MPNKEGRNSLLRMYVHIFFSSILFTNVDTFLQEERDQWIQNEINILTQQINTKEEHENNLENGISRDSMKVKQIEKETETLKGEILQQIQDEQKYQTFLANLHKEKNELLARRKEL